MFNLDAIEYSLQNTYSQDFLHGEIPVWVPSGVVWISPGAAVKHLTERYRYV